MRSLSEFGGEQTGASGTLWCSGLAKGKASGWKATRGQLAHCPHSLIRGVNLSCKG